MRGYHLSQIRYSDRSMDESSMIEQECQLLAPVGTEQVLPSMLAGMARISREQNVHVDEYLDAGSILRDRGIVLRRRTPAKGQSVWTVKLPDQTPEGATRSRVEMEWPRSGQLTDGQQTQRGQALALLEQLGVVIDETSVYGQLRTARSKGIYRSDGQSAEVAWDEVSYPDGSHELRLEVESLAGGVNVELLAHEINELVGGSLVSAPLSKGEQLLRSLQS